MKEVYMQKACLFGTLSAASLVGLSVVGGGAPALAVAINFDDQGLSGPRFFNSAGDAQILNVDTSAGNVRFSGGVILTNATNAPANQTSTYGTANNLEADGIRNNPTRQNPLVIEFETPVENFFLDVFNGIPLPLDYTVADDIGNFSTFSLLSNLQSGFQKIGFQAAGKRITITPDTSAEALAPRFSEGAYDFFIDNINFNTALPNDLLEPVEEVIVPMPDAAPEPEQPGPEQPEPEQPESEQPEPEQPGPMPDPVPKPISEQAPTPGASPLPSSPSPVKVPEPVSILSMLMLSGLGLLRRASSARR
ncbi:MAG: hypothetical protein AAFP20_15535 [Cyanobacteria bacterium J06614_10]